MRAKPALAIISGCRICGVARAGMLTLESGVMLCRPCANTVSSFLRRASPTFLNGLWVDAPGPAQREPAKNTPARIDDSSVAEFQRGTARVIRDEDFKVHWDLGTAYEEMGLVADAIAEFATSLDERAPHDMAQEGFAILFDTPRARAEALDSVVLAIRRWS